MDFMDIINTILLAAITGLIALALVQLRRTARVLGALPKLVPELEKLRRDLEPVLAGALPVFEDLQRALAPADVEVGFEVEKSAGIQEGSRVSELTGRTGTTAWPKPNEKGELEGELGEYVNPDGSINSYLYHLLCASKTLIYLSSATNKNLSDPDAVNGARSTAPRIAAN